MTTDKAFNAAIAVVEGNWEVAREFLRDEPGVSYGELLSRLDTAVRASNNNEIILQLSSLLKAALRVECPQTSNSENAVWFYAGVTAIENLLEVKLGGMRLDKK